MHSRSALYDYIRFGLTLYHAVNSRYFEVYIICVPGLLSIVVNCFVVALCKIELILIASNSIGTVCSMPISCI